MIVYSDTSFLSSVYLPDAHSAEADKRMARYPKLLITSFNRAELANAMYRQIFLHRASEADTRHAWNDFELDCRTQLFQPAEFPESAWDTTSDLARRFASTLGIRTLDSLHVACALELRAGKFWTFDERQEKLARAVGLDTSA